MARIRQKRKLRSGKAPVRQKPKKTQKPLLANPFLAEHWDRSQTLSQNYARLGLSAKLGKSSGGGEGVKRTGAGVKRKADGLAIGAERERVGVAEARIVRDAKTGAIVRVVEAGDAEGGGEQRDTGPWKALDDPLAELNEMVVESGEVPMEVQELDEDDEGVHEGDNIVKMLEKEAARPAVPKRRKQSDREKAFLQKLIERHGTDEERGCYKKMVKDTDLNVMQQSEGDLRKRVRRYLASGKGGWGT